MFTYFIRVDGSPTYSFLTALSGGIFNIVFNYIFIGQLHIGITGAALATFLGLLLLFLTVLPRLLELNGIWLAVPAAEILTPIVALWTLRKKTVA